MLLPKGELAKKNELPEVADFSSPTAQAIAG